MAKGRRFPSKVRVLGWEIRVRVVSRRWIIRMTGDKTCVGCWSSSRLTIYILEGQAWPEMVDTYFHELDHAWTDVKGWERTDLLGRE